MRLPLIILLISLPFIAHGQSSFVGVVKDATTGMALPGVNVVTKNQQQTTTDADGHFSIKTDATAADVSFSFIGFETLIRTLHDGENAVILLRADETLDTKSHYFRTSFGLGYVADLPYVKRGVMANWTIQSIGQTSINLQAIGKYWEENKNSGFELTLAKEFSGPLAILADNLMISHRSLSYGEQHLELHESRLILTNRLPSYFAFDIGASTKQYVDNASSELIKNKFWSGIFGISKAFSFLSAAGKSGVWSNIYYNAKHRVIEVGAYKAINIRKVPQLIVLAKYYNDDRVNGVMVALRMTVFSTEYSCCDSWYLYQEDMVTMK